MYSVYQHWDPLKVCMVGKSYPPEFYSFIKNTRVRNVMEKIARETEEDYQKLVTLLESFNVEVLRPDVFGNYESYLTPSGKIALPPMTPRDYTVMIGEKFYFNGSSENLWEIFRGADWPVDPVKNIEECAHLPVHIREEIAQFLNKQVIASPWDSILKKIKNPIDFHNPVNGATTTRVGRDLYFGTEHYEEDQSAIINRAEKLFPEYRCHVVNTGGHSDGTFCPVKPGLIVSLRDVPTYAETFPGWEVVYLPNQSWAKVRPFLKLKEKNHGKWWVPGEELNDDFTEFVESWLNHWVGYVEETVFDVNMLVIDEKNVVCNNYNEKVFEAFERHGITPHIVNFRHRYFWDGGLHCITSDLHREGTMKDYFPNRG